MRCKKKKKNWQQNPETDNRAGKNICYSMTDKNLMSLEDRIPTDWKDKNGSGTKDLNWQLREEEFQMVSEYMERCWDLIGRV